MSSFTKVASTTPATLPSYDGTMFDGAHVTESVVVQNVQNTAGPDRSQLFTMLTQGVITAEQFIELDKNIMITNRENVGNANAEMFKGFKGKTVKAKDVMNGTPTGLEGRC
ncbi:hypothetical protein BDQ17DRAFT_1404588 [Cyathus striatus]|nr:hypothetical protein BDQ17DRAFT_1404588 [Cyathus striatus]